MSGKNKKKREQGTASELAQIKKDLDDVTRQGDALKEQRARVYELFRRKKQ